MNITKPIVATAYIATIIVMGAATVIEKCLGNDTVLNHIYGSPWFIALWVIMAISGLLYMIKVRLMQRPVVFLLHIALMLILAGALTTHIFGMQTNVHLRMDDTYIGNLPFDIKLNRFEVINYPGTQSPMDYVSDIVFVERDGKETEATVSMNNIAEYRNYRFYQSAYDYDSRGTILSVSHDPWGIGITYAGYFMLFFTMVLLLILPNEGFRKALRNVSKTATVFICLISCSTAMATPSALPKDVAEEMGNLHVYYNHRICPLQTVARDFTKKMYGSSSYDGLTAEQVMTGWIFFPTQWENEEMIKAKKGEKKYVSYSELCKMGDLNNADNEKLNIIRMLLNGELMRIYPYRDKDNNIVWYSQGDNLPLDMKDDQWLFIKKSLDYLGEMAVNKEYNKFTLTVGKIGDYQKRYAAETLPDEYRFNAEKIYNRLDFTKHLAIMLMTLGIVTFVIFTIRWSKGKQMKKCDKIAMNIIVGIVGIYLACVMSLRGYVSGHLPLTNGYETMQFMAFSTIALTLIMQRRFVLIFPFGTLLSGACLMVSMMGESNPQITNMMPVLASPLLSIHVCVIMTAYSLLAFMMFNGITAIIIKATGHTGKERQIETLYNISRVMVYPALFMLCMGIFIGAIWANQSWGRYWGWDPKEVWALITMMIYAVMVHKSLAPSIQKPINFHIYSIVAFLTVLMTYFGVNFLLGGMHSYATN